MKDIGKTKQSQYNVMFFTLKLLALFFCAAPLFQYFFKDTVSRSALEHANFMVLLISISIFTIITFIWLIMDRNRKKIKFAVFAEIALFFAVCIASIMFSGAHESYYKFLFIFIVISYTVELGMKIGVIVASLASVFILGLDLFMDNSGGVNTQFQTDIALCSMFVVIAWILGSYVKIANEHIAQLTGYANLDGLTNIYNHRYFQDSLRNKCDESLKNNKPLSLLMLDIDYFKTYNDIYGHQKGDLVLKQLAELLGKNTRSEDILCRYGGEEFALILDNTEKNKAIEIGETIRKSVEEYAFEGQELLPAGSVTVSVGVAGFNGEGDNPVELVNRADSALYRAKFFRRNRVEQYVSVFDNVSHLDSRLTSLKSLINVIHSRDSYTYNHVERVVWYCQLYADYMKLSEEEKTKLVYSAYLHDLGKINVAKNILISTSKLTDEEWIEMKRHPVDSAEMIRRVEGLEDMVDIVLHHHEKYDGRGYPDGISGEQINPLARVLTVADSFDAMTSNRPYQTTKTYTDAFAEIRRCKGTQFDPIIAENFIAAIGESL
ncbi:MAG: diguanylate cyclase [Firmicutes bacterium HGW-Firmicutes-21]|nr:MAG: diguanylate cyclase [Firmicutes bacterium HGW-Firmicutes-21]